MESIQHVFKENGSKETIDSACNGENKKEWLQSLSNEWGRLAQGNDMGVHFNDVIDFISQKEVPTDRKVTYATFVLDHRPLKTEPWRVRITVGGDKLTYDNDAGSPAANIIETKLLVNSVISDAKKGARFMSADIKDFFLNTPMERPEYMRVHYRHIPQDIRNRYNLDSKVNKDGFIYIKIKKGMYGLKQAAILAYNHIKQHLKDFGYHPVQGTVGLWTHKTRNLQFCLCVDDFGVKYFKKEDVEHLLHSIGSIYKYTTDWTGKNYCGMHFDWHYDAGYVDVSMPGYVKKALKRLQYQASNTHQYSPHHHEPFKYATKGTRQYANAPDTSPLLSPKDTKWIQSVAGSFLYYSRVIDYTLLPALNSLASQQSQPTENTRQIAHRLMDYAATYPNTFIRYKASDMILNVDSDAAYLVAPKARSRIAGYYYLSSKQTDKQQPHLNGAILVECKTLRHVVASAAEAETAGVFHNAQTALPLRILLQALHHPQPPTPVKTDNTTTTGFIHNNIHQKRSKSWDMRYFWLRDRATQKQFNFYWHPGIYNYADYFTKHHPTIHHRQNRNRFVKDSLNAVIQSMNSQCALRGCAN